MSRNTDGELVRRILCGPIGSARTLSSGPTTAAETPATHPLTSVAGGFGEGRSFNHAATANTSEQR